MASTYTPIATTTSTSSSVTFSSINSAYTDLILIVNWAASATDYPVELRFNSDTGTNYSSTHLYGNGSSAGSGRDSNSNQMYLALYVTGGTSFSSNAIFQIMNYSNSNVYKTVLSRSNNATGSSSGGTEAAVGLWRSTAAINSITIKTDGATFASGSTFTLYGIQAA